MSFLTDLITKLEPLILSVIENLITKGERQGGSVSVADLREAQDQIKGKVAETKKTAAAHEGRHGGN
jgi:hypothetical protein